MTERLYYRDASLLEFDARVIDHGDSDQRIILDRTAFYPTSGGQPHDVGMLGSARVIDVIDDGERVVHVCDRVVPPGPVRGSIDAHRRRDYTQQHTAQHLLSAIAADAFRWPTVSVHFGERHSTVEFDTTGVNADQLEVLERQANAIVAEARPVAVTFEDATDAARAGLRKPSDRSGEIRVVAIAGIDRSACGGTHVNRTSEIGAIALTGTERLRHHTRVSFVAGDRVLAHLRRVDAALAGLATAASCSPDELATIVPQRMDETRRLAAQVGALEQEVAAARVATLAATQTPGADGLMRIACPAGESSPSMLRAMAQNAATLPRALFVAVAESPRIVYFAAGADSGVDAGSRLKAVLGPVGGRGGGSPRVAQGSVLADANLDALVDRLMGAPVDGGDEDHDA